MNEQKMILITGASGNLGNKLRQHLAERYTLRLLDIHPRHEGVRQADLSEWDNQWVEQFRDVDTVVHLAADPKASQTWDRLVAPNMDSVINIFAASVQGGVKRVIYASSNHAMGAYKDIPEPALLTTDLPQLPGTHYMGRDGLKHNSVAYGGAKLFGERLGKCYADIHGLSVIAVRIGWTKPGDNEPPGQTEHEPWFKQMWLSNRDYCQLMNCCIEADPAIGFAVINGMSNNAGMRWDLDHTRDLVGYEAQDGLEMTR